MGRKRKLTLSVNGGAIEKARELGINISELTERILKAITEISDVDAFKVQKGYLELFEALMPFVRKLDLCIKIGERHKGGYFDDTGDYYPWTESYYLTKNGICVKSPEIEIEYNLIVDGNSFFNRLETLEDLYPPLKILENFIKEISKKTKRLKERLKSIEIAIQIVKNLHNSEVM